MSTGSGVSPPVRVNVPPFEDPEELDLQLHGHLRHLVEEEGAVRRSLEHTVVPSIGAGEAAPLVTEELALNEHGRERAAIQCDIRPVPASAQVVKGSRDQFLASAALSHDEDRGVRRCHA